MKVWVVTFAESMIIGVCASHERALALVRDDDMSPDPSHYAIEAHEVLPDLPDVVVVTPPRAELGS